MVVLVFLRNYSKTVGNSHSILGIAVGEIV